MPLPPSRQHSIGSVDVTPDVTRTTTAENPFASFYESRRQISFEMHDETADPSSSITRAYIIPESLLALARGERENGGGAAAAGPVGESSLARRVATDHADDATEPANMFRFRPPLGFGIAAEWLTLQRIAWQLAGWLRRAWRRSIPD